MPDLRCNIIESDMIAEYSIQLIMAGLSALGFAVLFHVERRFLFSMWLGGFLCWAAYLGSQQIWSGSFAPSLAASIVVALYAEILARVCKAPSTPFFAVSEMPLFPGGSLYYCMLNALEGNTELSLAYGRATFATALGIAGGMSIVWALCDLSRKIAARRRTQM